MAQIVAPMQSLSGTATLPLAIPNEVGLLGVTLETQAASLSPASNALGLALSNRGTLTIGSPYIAAGPFLNPANGHRYIVLLPDTWQGNQTKAVALGGHLVTIDDASENGWITALLGGLGGTVGTQVWVGLNRGPSTPWRWASGAPVSYVNWAPGEPNNATGGEYSTALYPTNNPWGSAGEWNDAPGGWLMFAVVEI